MRSQLTPASLLVLALSTAGCRALGLGGDDTGPHFYPGLGAYEREVTTASPEAQRWFDQGLKLLYGFNHDEAIRSFTEAARLDPGCAMAWWGVAYANGLHINNMAMAVDQSRAAWDASREALRNVEGAAPVERALVEAVAQRYAWPVPEDREPLDRAYAAAMEKVWKAYPADADVGALYAEALMDLQPWDLWTHDGVPKGRATEIVEVLEAVMAMRPDHPGANHFYIHAVEASKTPERAVAASDRLREQVTGIGHLVHMPSHIYIRVGRYPDASDGNERAIQADEAYFALAPEQDFYSLYFLHNVHMLAYAAMMEGRREVALAAGRRIERQIPQSFLRNRVEIADAFVPTKLHVMVRFGMWKEILEQDEPAEFQLLSQAFRYYARGVALSALGRPAEARAELSHFDAVAAVVPDTWTVGNNAAWIVLPLARSMLVGEIAYREGRRDDAFAVLREGVRREDELVYDEPPGWMQPVRHALGALLAADGRIAEAEEVYRADLEKNPDNGWSMLGLEQCLRAQNKNLFEAESLAKARATAWARADVAPSSSCYCEPGGVGR